jgi:BirA family biotin operon repressor/biotin-[acetyl-CoA-carboxylase] ligase
MDFTEALVAAVFRNHPFVSRVCYFPTVGSTQAEAQALALSGAGEGTLVVADSQTRGRGRRQRSWQSPPGSNLYVSIVLRPPLPPSSAGQVPLLSGVAVADALRELWPSAPWVLKWPNDVLAENRKVCGILAEMHTTGGSLDFVVVGFGVNVNMTKGELDPALADCATSLREVSGQAWSRLDVLAILLDWLEKRYRLWLREGFEPIRAAWLEKTRMIGAPVTVRFGGEARQGTVLGIDPQGALLIRGADGRCEALWAGDATVQKT